MTTNTQIKSAEKALVEAQDKHNERSQARAEAEARIKSIKDAWSRGDDSVPASAMIEAEAEIQRLSSLIAASDKAVRVAQRNVKSAAPVLAETVARIVGTTLYGVQAEAVTSVPRTKSQTPKVYVVEIGERRAGEVVGQLKGDVEIVAVGPDCMKSFDRYAVDGALRSGGVYLPYGSQTVTERQGSYVYRQRVTATPICPVIPNVAPNRVRGLGTIIQSFVANTRNPATGDDTLTGTGGAEWIKESIDNDGVRRLDLEISLHVRATKAAIQTLDRIEASAERFLADRFKVDKGLSGIGSVESVKVTTESEPFDLPFDRVQQGVRAVARVTVVSKVAQ